MQTAVECTSSGVVLRGMLHAPDHITGKSPAVILFHGFTGSKTGAQFVFVELCRRLEKKGIASVRFDFSGSGESDGDFMGTTLTSQLSDASNILDYVRSLDFVDKEKVMILGMSLGGVIASLLAADRKDEIHALCLWCPAAIVVQDLKEGKLQNIDISHLDNWEYIDVRGLKLGKDFVNDALCWDIYATASYYNKNVLLIHGDQDDLVPISVSEKYLETYGQKAELKVVPGAGHTYESVGWRNQLLDHTLDFFNRNLTRR
ncbi:hypothetical protein SD71_00235 [Cohnella kolymensis]|uniref:Peptidase S9 prolyl oligopeptidase catalytic domain-containing protein n=1 Tax=Cohnella kolymensis TaxID=1590652 RepID=A0ABR5A8G4_9BACL|nr:alpha/beta hydrolase [Cohnella kolymensis]KIL37207.1 hypothetical protein SD71_00235 [Cohnella kolymensis]